MGVRIIDLPIIRQVVQGGGDRTEVKNGGFWCLLLGKRDDLQKITPHLPADFRFV